MIKPNFNLIKKQNNLSNSAKYTLYKPDYLLKADIKSGNQVGVEGKFIVT